MEVRGIVSEVYARRSETGAMTVGGDFDAACGVCGIFWVGV